jgi:hypothetical protein
MALFHHKTTIMQSVYFPLHSSSMSPFHKKGSQRSQQRTPYVKRTLEIAVAGGHNISISEKLF